MAHNLGMILRKLNGVGKPREWVSMRDFLAVYVGLWSRILAYMVATARELAPTAGNLADRLLGPKEQFERRPGAASSTC